MTDWLARTRALAFGAILLSAAPVAFADGPPAPTPDVAAPPVHAAPIETPTPAAEPAADASAPLEGRSGQIPLMDEGLSLDVPAGYKFYDADAAQDFLRRNDAAAPNGTVLGLIAPASADIDAPGAWATVVSYEPINYVPADGADGLSDPAFEDSVRTARDAQGRAFEGFAVQPAFDAMGASLTWAERSAAPGAGGRDFRHEQRLLGRYGVAGLTSIGSADQMGAITTAAPALFSMVSFPEGSRYGDYSPASDQVSAYSIPGLITGQPESNPNLVADAAMAGEGAGGDAIGAGGGIQGMFPWIALGVAALAGLGYMLSRRRRDVDAHLSPDD